MVAMLEMQIFTTLPEPADDAFVYVWLRLYFHAFKGVPYRRRYFSVSPMKHETKESAKLSEFVGFFP